MTVSDLFNALSQKRHTLDTLTGSIGMHPDVVEATSGLDLRHYASGDKIEAYIEAELRNGNAVTWWLEIYGHDTGFVIECSFLDNRPHGQTTLQDMPTRCSKTISEAEQSFTDFLGAAQRLDWYATEVMQPPSIHTAI